MTIDPFDELVDEIRLTFHSLASVASRFGGIDAPRRAVLEHLVRNGPATVPDIARRRGVSRQHIQTIVNALGDGGLVIAEPNPAHRRSPLIALTPTGREHITAITTRERESVAPFVEQLDPAALASSVDLLRALRRHLDRLGDHPPSPPAQEAS